MTEMTDMLSLAKALAANPKALEAITASPALQAVFEAGIGALSRAPLRAALDKAHAKAPVAKAPAKAPKAKAPAKAPAVKVKAKAPAKAKRKAPVAKAKAKAPKAKATPPVADTTTLAWENDSFTIPHTNRNMEVHESGWQKLSVQNTAKIDKAGNHYQWAWYTANGGNPGRYVVTGTGEMTLDNGAIVGTTDLVRPPHGFWKATA